MVSLRPYQVDLFNRITKSLKNGNKRVLGVLPCGGGKSYLFKAMVDLTKNGYVLILTHRQELKSQHADLLADSNHHRLAMVMTEANRLGQYEKPSLIICDEAHLSRANSWVKVLEYYSDVPVVGLTATPTRLSGDPLGDIYQDMVEGVTVKELIEMHCLAPYEYYAPTVVETDEIAVRMGDYVIKDLDTLMSNKAIYGDVISHYKHFADGEKSIAYCVSVKHAEMVAQAFRDAGYSAESVSANTPNRLEIMEKFREGEITILCNVGIISEGISINDVTCCLMLRPTESVALGIQQMMRCMRYLPGKTAKIIDFVGNYTRVGLPDDDREWSLTKQIKKKSLDENGNYPIRRCPECFLTFKTAPICPYCGAEYPLSPRELKAHSEIELKRITQEEIERVNAEKKRARMEVGRAKTYGELVAIGRKRGYDNPTGWAYMIMKGRKR